MNSSPAQHAHNQSFPTPHPTAGQQTGQPLLTLEQVGESLITWYTHVASGPDPAGDPVKTGLPVLDQVEDPYVAAPDIREFLARVTPGAR